MFIIVYSIYLYLNIILRFIIFKINIIQINIINTFRFNINYNEFKLILLIINKINFKFIIEIIDIYNKQFNITF